MIKIKYFIIIVSALTICLINLELYGQKIISGTSKEIHIKLSGVVEVVDSLLIGLPQNPIKNNRYALIIGNKEYKRLIGVDFAINDAKAFNKYAVNVMGISENNIIYDSNVTVTHFKELIECASNLMDSARELIVYYSGHGFPSESGDAFLMPVDVHEGNVDLFGIKLSDFYEELTKNNPQKVTVFIDACFSGGGKNGLSIAKAGIKRPVNDVLLKKNIVVFTASAATEVAQQYNQKEYGLFTYYLLNILKKSNGNITYADLAKKLKSEVYDRSNLLVELKKQTPSINRGADAIDWENWIIYE